MKTVVKTIKQSCFQSNTMEQSSYQFNTPVKPLFWQPVCANIAWGHQVPPTYCATAEEFLDRE